jgi:nucleotide-binding universal stress UspA family protein
MKRILVCTDGEQHTLNAERHAVELAERFEATIVGLYVQSTFLEKFTHEIYAVNREACRDHLFNELTKEGTSALENLGRRCADAGIPYESRIRQGDIAEEIVSEASSGEYDLLIMGAKLLGTWQERLESVNVPLAVFKRAPLAMLFVR